jgi:hypothetical protein
MFKRFRLKPDGPVYEVHRYITNAEGPSRVSFMPYGVSCCTALESDCIPVPDPINVDDKETELVTCSLCWRTRHATQTVGLTLTRQHLCSQDEDKCIETATKLGKGYEQ